MNSPDEDTVLKAMEDAGRILVEYIAGAARRHKRCTAWTLLIK
jgi:hypothetical protein